MSQPQKIMVGGVWRPLMTSARQPAKECCCEAEPPECCLYPWPDPEGMPLYPDSDLPASLILNLGATAISMSKVSGYRYEGTDSGNDYYIKANPGSDIWEIGTTDSEDTDEPFTSGACLVAEFGGADSVEDEFPDTLTYTDTTVPASCSLTRDSLCCWSGTLVYPPEAGLSDTAITLCYYVDPPSLEVSPAWPDKPCWVISFGSGWEEIFYFAKTDPQSGPTGDYSEDTGNSVVS